MARTNLPITDLSANGSIADPAYTAADAANGMVVAAGSEMGRLALHVRNGGAGAITVTLQAGANPPALRQGVGNLAVSVGAGANRFIGPVESMRFAQADGALYVDFSGATSVTVAAYRLPDTV